VNVLISSQEVAESRSRICEICGICVKYSTPGHDFNLNTDRIHVGDASFNRLILSIGGEYEWRTPASLSLRTGIKYRTFKLGDEAIGRLSTVSLYCWVKRVNFRFSLRLKRVKN
jgi:hypothetical protein